MFRFALASALATAEACESPDPLFITSEDCGAKHAHMDDLETVTAGYSNGTTTATGTVDEDVISAQFTATVSALGAQLSSCSGDGTQDIVCDLSSQDDYEGVNVTMKALSFPIPTGTVSITVEISWPIAHGSDGRPFWPARVAPLDVHIAADEQNGESVICLDVHTTFKGHCLYGGGWTCETAQTTKSPWGDCEGADDNAGTCVCACGGVYCAPDFWPSNASTPGPAIV